MAKVTIDVDALDRLTDGAAEGGLRSALGEYERILKEDVLNRPGTGRQYGKHTASAPGEPPAPDVGNLKANTNADPDIREDGDDLVGQVTSSAAYSEALHVGTERVAARPFMDVPANDHQYALARAFVDGAQR